MSNIRPAVDDDRAVQRKSLRSSSPGVKEKVDVEQANTPASEDSKEEEARESESNKKLRTVFLIGLAALIFGWWISSTILKATRGRWQVCRSRYHPCTHKSCRVVQTVFAWFFLT